MRLFKTLLSIIFFSIYLTFTNLKSSVPKGGEMPSSEEMEQMQKMFEGMSEEEYLTLLNSVFTEYKNSDPETQKIFAEEMGMTVEQMNAVVKEFDTTIGGSLESESPLIEKSNDKNQNIVEKPVIKKEDSEKTKLLFYINLIDEIEKILSQFISKTTEQTVKNIVFLPANIKILSETEITIYYLINIKTLLNNIYSNNSTIKINFSDLDLLNTNLQKINNSVKNLVNGINLDDLKKSYSKVEEDFLNKYGVRNKDLIEDAILSKIEETKEVIKKIKTDKNIDEKTRLKLIEEKKFVLSLLEDDLNKIEINFEKEEKLKIENLKKQKEIITENVLSICSELSKIYGETGKGGLIDSLEAFMKKYLAEEYKISKEREKIIKKQYDDEQKKQKVSAGTVILDNVPKMQSNDRDYDDYDDYNNSGYDGNSGGDYDRSNYNEGNEKNPADSLKDQKEIYGGGGGAGQNNSSDLAGNSKSNKNSGREKNKSNENNNSQDDKKINNKKEQNKEDKIKEDLDNLLNLVQKYSEINEVEEQLKNQQKDEKNKINEENEKNKIDEEFKKIQEAKSNFLNETIKTINEFKKEHFEYGLDLKEKKQNKNKEKEENKQESPLIIQILTSVLKIEEIKESFFKKINEIYSDKKNKDKIPDFYKKLLESVISNESSKNKQKEQSNIQNNVASELEEEEA